MYFSLYVELLFLNLYVTQIQNLLTKTSFRYNILNTSASGIYVYYHTSLLKYYLSTKPNELYIIANTCNYVTQQVQKSTKFPTTCFYLFFSYSLFTFILLIINLANSIPELISTTEYSDDVINEICFLSSFVLVDN